MLVVVLERILNYDVGFKQGCELFNGQQLVGGRFIQSNARLRFEALLVIPIS